MSAGPLELEAIAIGIKRPSFAEAQAAFLADDFETAEVAIRAHLRTDPADPAAALMLAKIAASCNATVEADNLFKRAILLAPHYTEAHLAFAKHARETGRYELALEALNQVLRLQPDQLNALALKASALEQLRRFDEADTAFTELHRHHPKNARGWANHGFMLKTVGRQKDAIKAYRTAIGLDVSYGLAWWGLSNLKTIRFDQQDIAAMQAALQTEQMSAENRLHMLYALGKALDDNARFEEAFRTFSEGAAIRLKEVPYDPDQVTQHTNKMRETCTPKFFADRAGWGSERNDPIFIVSLPRSGSTLVEQILSSHPMIEGTEELRDIERIALSIAPTGGTGGWLDVLPGMDRAQIRSLGDHYIEATKRFRHTDRPFFTDKMPSNWVFAAMIMTILPNAKIIDVKRHPMGCGLANFMQHFNWGINYSYDLGHIANFYKNNVRAIAHLDAVAPNRIHHLTYESLVEDTEREVRRLLDYVGLPFDERCMRFFENDRAVYTPSSEQVRSPINRDGMERWKSYAPYLGELEEALGSVLDCYPQTPPLT
ncbi:hypothetical protein AB433_13840 [Croceicoccus naphthovorans]|uniref:Uncharacterized protein n=2 Tax=Croceicoccus naphthovorans TaxID=1348774 RepID=A0A0G3XMF3_9SPHN|nr:hypothetical protein AB433_13840 [Croceicoccus naphthovorans]